MAGKSGGLKEWLIPFLFVLCAGWAIWHGPAYLVDFWGYEEGSNLFNHMNEMHQRKDVTPNLSGLFGGVADIIDWAALLLLPIIFYFGTRNVVLAQMEFAHFSRVDRIAMFIGRITMILIISMTLVMLYEVFLRYAIEAPTLWANELTLWIGGFVFLLSGVYAMQQRSHIRIFILYDVLPRWMQHVCDTIWVALLWFFMACLVFGSYKQVFVNKFYKWQTFGTAFDPPIPATIQPMILIVIILISIQALLNLIADWGRDPNELTQKDLIDKEELEALKKSAGAN
ncbi:TRAP transporter small permease [Granulosicoccus sp.]|jgi:TRAP-type mannitol/chloroaromatic compound transport system permease small subunit|nr:TRAP transporter small permease [Granulosicoccus sp.]MDB4222153.1 TRAP transporter small permease [Granulosicoccus sp.]